MPVTDSTLIKISWDTTTETLTVAELRVRFEHHANNLFDDGVWTRPPSLSGWDNTQATNLNTVLSVIQPGEEWTCDNCTVSLASVPLCLECVNTIGGASGEPDFDWHPLHTGEECGADDHAENTEVITHDEQEMSQGYHGPSFKPVAIPCRFCGAEDTSGECGECTEKLSDDFSESENVLADHDWDDFSLEEGEDMLDAIISMLDGFDADRMASYLMGMQDALNGQPAPSVPDVNDYAAGHGRIMECIDATIAATVDVQRAACVSMRAAIGPDQPADWKDSLSDAVDALEGGAQ